MGISMHPYWRSCPKYPSSLKQVDELGMVILLCCGLQLWTILLPLDAVICHVLNFFMYTGSVEFALMVAAGETLYFFIFILFCFFFLERPVIYHVLDGGTCNTVETIHRYPWLKTEVRSQVDGMLRLQTDALLYWPAPVPYSEWRQLVSYCFCSLKLH